MLVTHFSEEGIPLESIPLPDPPAGWRWALGGWMGSSPTSPWPRLEPDPDVSITLTAERWRGVCGCLAAAADFRPGTVLAHEAIGLAREINRCLPDGQGYVGILECEPGCDGGTVRRDQR